MGANQSIIKVRNAPDPGGLPGGGIAPGADITALAKGRLDLMAGAVGSFALTDGIATVTTNCGPLDPQEAHPLANFRSPILDTIVLRRGDVLAS